MHDYRKSDSASGGRQQTGVGRHLEALRPKVERWVSLLVAQFGICPPDVVIRRKFELAKSSLNKIIKRSELLLMERQARDAKKRRLGTRGKLMDYFSLAQIKDEKPDPSDGLFVKETFETVQKLTPEAAREELLGYVKDAQARLVLEEKMRNWPEEELRHWLVDQRIFLHKSQRT